MMEEATIENLLSEYGQILEVPVGISMWPMLKNREDQILIKSVSFPLHVNDVVLFKRENGQYVLHRIIKIRHNDYVIRGDNCLDNEYGITDNQIIGVLQGFYKGDHYIDCYKSLAYKVYVLICRITFLPRVLVKRVFMLLKKLKREKGN